MKLNPLSIFIVVFTIFLIEVANLLIFPVWSHETKSVVVQYATLILAGLAFITFLYDYTMKKDDFLDTKVEVTSNDKYHSIKTQVFNKSGMKKKVSLALLFISKQEYLPVVAMNEALETLHLPLNFLDTNDFENLKNQIDSPLFTINAAIIPLSFYYCENVKIANENPAFTYSFNNNEKKLKDGIYTVRFFIFCKGKLHRSTSDSLVIKNKIVQTIGRNEILPANNQEEEEDEVDKGNSKNSSQQKNSNITKRNR
jgi:hypothetical protein